MEPSSREQELQPPAQAQSGPTVTVKAGPETLEENSPTPAEEPPFRPKVLFMAPVFSTSNLDRWLEHYRALGFTTARYGHEYGFASLDRIEIHVSVSLDHDPATTAGCAYLRVEDADGLYALWSRVEGGRGPAPVDTEYGLREGGHVDPDGNLIRYGSLIRGGSVDT